MLTLENATDELESQYDVFKTHSSGLFESMESFGRRMQLKAEIDLFTLFDHDMIVYVIEGYFRFMFGNKVVRLYSENDFVAVSLRVDGAVLSSEFASEIVVFQRGDFMPILSQNELLLSRWLQLMDLENRINLGLCAQLVDERIHPSLELRQFLDGDVIVQEDTDSDEIYEMITGQGIVKVSEKEVGIIEAGEIFGEMSALAGCRRTAAVFADGQCCVRVVKREDFFKLLEVDRHLSANIARTLAKRIIDLNQRLVSKS